MTSSPDHDREQPRWEMLLILLAGLAGLCCICSSTEIALHFWPEYAQASLLSDKQADYTGGPGYPHFAVFESPFKGEIATDIARLEITPAGDEGGRAVTVLPLPTPRSPAGPAGPASPRPQTTPVAAPVTPAATVHPTPTGPVASTPTAAATGRATLIPAKTPLVDLPPATLPPVPPLSSSPTRPPDTPSPANDDDDDDDDGGDDPLPKPTPTPIPTNTPVIVQISGRIFEDANYSGGAGTPFGGGDAGLPNVVVELYAGSTRLASTTTDGSGRYTFTDLPANGTYRVRAVSATIGDGDTPPAAGFNGGFTTALAEQTYENNGLAGNGGAGALGGDDPLVDDTATAGGAGPGDTNVTVTTAGSDVTGVDLGFAFNLVANPNDAGQGSFRQAIANANAINGTGSLVFNIAGPGPYTIRPTAALPEITDPAIIAGTTQPGFAGSPIVEIDGRNVTTASGLTISAGNSTVRGLVINRFGTGIELAGGGGNVIAGNYLGLDVTGGTALGNGVNIDVVGSSNNRLGGTTAADQNVVAGSVSAGIRLSGGANGNLIQGNLIGLNAAGTTALGGGIGIALYDVVNTRIGGPNAVERNVISTGGSVGLYLTDSGGSGHIIQGNYIGTDVAGTAAVGNLRGIHVDNGAFFTRIGGPAAGAGNLIAHSIEQGISITGFSQEITVRGNSIYTNGGLGIDLGGDGPTANDLFDGNPGPNDLFNFPVIDSAVLSGGDLTVTGFARPDSVIDFFIADPDPSGLGEGRTYLTSLTEGDPGVDLDSGTGSYNDPLAGADTTNRFRFTFSAGAVILNDKLTATATDSAPFGDTSEFGPNIVVSLPPPVQITGRIFEDVDYSGGAGTAFGGGDAGLPNVTVELYEGPTLLASAVTDAAGNYTFPAAPGGGTLTVRAVSATIGDGDTPPAAGFNGGFTTALAEQTYEHNGLAGNGGAGALGGDDPLVDDTATAVGAGPGDTNVTVTTAGADVTGVDLGFAFNLVANSNDAGQGSFRQAIANANAINGTGSLVFDIAGSAPHTIRPVSALPEITDPVIIDGTTQPDFAGTPVIELNGTGAGVNSNGLHISAGSSVVRGLVINHFGVHGIYLEAAGNNLVAGNFIGTDVAGLTALPNTGSGISIFGACPPGGNIIGGSAADRNLISGNSSGGITIYACNGNIIQGNTIGTDVTGLAALPNTGQGIYTEASSNNLIGGTTPGAGNLISANTDDGVAIWGFSGDGNVLQGNSIGVDITGAPVLGNGGDGIKFEVAATDNTVEAGNIIAANGGHGVYIFSGSGNAVLTNTIYANGGNGVYLWDGSEGAFRANSIYDNGQLGIDLAESPAASGLVTKNDSGDVDTGPNGLFNFPVIEDATISGPLIIVTGFARPASSIDFFIAGSDPSRFGEGQTYLRTLLEGTPGIDLDAGSGFYNDPLIGQDTTNRFRFIFPAGSLKVGDKLTATATDANGNTSEFSFNITVN